MANIETQKSLKISSIETLTPFYIPFFSIKIAEWERKKERLLSMVDWNNSSAIENDHFTDYHLNIKNGCPYREQFENVLSEELQVFADHIKTNLVLKEIWAQRYHKEKHMVAHTHGSKGFSCVLYAEFDPSQHKATTFMAPFNNFINDDTLYFTPEVTEGTIVIFPSMLPHYAVPNTSSIPRTIFSLNMDTVVVQNND